MQNPEHLRPDYPDQTVVLVADDEVVIQNVARITLEREGYFVLTAENGEEALYLSRQYPGDIHLLLTDLKMPKMNGIELIGHVAQERPGIRIVLMSGYTGDYDPELPFLQKPFGPKLLSETIRGLVPVRRHDSGGAEGGT